MSTKVYIDANSSIPYGSFYIDGLKANQSFNGDTLILATFNPNTLTATMFSLPRDLYVPIACNHNRYAKINSSVSLLQWQITYRHTAMSRLWHGTKKRICDQHI